MLFHTLDARRASSVGKSISQPMLVAQGNCSAAIVCASRGASDDTFLLPQKPLMHRRLPGFSLTISAIKN